MLDVLEFVLGWEKPQQHQWHFLKIQLVRGHQVRIASRQLVILQDRCIFSFFYQFLTRHDFISSVTSLESIRSRDPLFLRVLVLGVMTSGTKWELCLKIVKPKKKLVYSFFWWKLATNILLFFRSVARRLKHSFWNKKIPGCLIGGVRGRRNFTKSWLNLAGLALALAWTARQVFSDVVNPFYHATEIFSTAAKLLSLAWMKARMIRVYDSSQYWNQELGFYKTQSDSLWAWARTILKI